MPVVDLRDERPAWVERAVVYAVTPFFFVPRRLPDVTARLGELAALGVDTLWLSPTTAATEGDFGYAVTDFFRLRADFGSEADLRALVRAAHGRGPAGNHGLRAEPCRLGTPLLP